MIAKKAQSWFHNHNWYLFIDNLDDKLIKYLSQKPICFLSILFRSYLQFIFNKRLKNIKYKFVFKSDLQIYNILLGKKTDRFNNCYFYIIFNKKENIILNNIST